MAPTTSVTAPERGDARPASRAHAQHIKSTPRIVAPMADYHNEGGEPKDALIRVFDGFVSRDGNDLYGFCGHRWNVYGWLPGNTLRTAHCRTCSQEITPSHLLIVNRPNLTAQETAEVRRRYRSALNNDQTAVSRVSRWRTNQQGFVLQLVRAGRS